MRYFMAVEGLVNLEKREKWGEARELLHSMWNADKQSSEKLIRLLSECWYVLSLWDCCMNTESLSFQVFQNSLIECTEFGMHNFRNDSRFLCILGYMTSLLPYLFYISGSDRSYAEWEQRGRAMLDKSSELDPCDLVAKTLRLGVVASSTKYSEARRLLLPKLTDFFPGETAIEMYFRDVLSTCS